MKNILTTVATATLFTGLALSSVAANSVLVADGKADNTDNNISMDIQGKGSDINLTLDPEFVYQGASFDLIFENGGIAKNNKVILCVGATEVGSLQDSGSKVVDDVMTNPVFSFIDDAATKLLITDNNVTFENTDCNSNTLTVVGLADKACETVTAQIDNGKSTQGKDITSLTTNVAKLGTTKQFIKISCTAPECFVTSNNLHYEDTSTAPGVNIPLSPLGAAANVANHNILTATCPDCDEAAAAAAVTSNCTVSITIANTAPVNSDLNITKLTYRASFDGKTPLNASDMNMSIAGQAEKNHKLDTNIPLTIPSLAGGESVQLFVRYESDGSKNLGLGTVSALINNLETNNTGEKSVVTFDQNITTMRKGSSTDFTVPYMSGAGASQANFVKVSTLLGAGTTTLSAMISDAEGHSCPVTYNDVPANGGSTFIFASKLPTGSQYQALIPVGKCSNLTSDLYSVKFSAGASVNAVGYMRTKRGERTIDIF